MKNRFTISLLATGFALTGCRSPDMASVVPKMEQPEGWATTLNSKEKLAAEELAVWWTQFDDEILWRLVQRSLDENLNLQVAAARVEESLALRGVAAGERVPLVNGSAAVMDINQSLLEGGVDYTGYSVGFDASWELDLWGRIKKTVDAADANVQASVEDLRGVRALIASQVVSGYITLRELQLRQELAISNIERQRETLKLTQGRFNSGLSPQLDVNQARQNLSGTEAALPSLRQQEKEALRALEVLAGYTPGSLEELLNENQEVPVASQAKLMDVPANVLRRRPDIRAAEQRLYAAALRVGVAEADLYPRISLSGTFAWQSDETGNLFDSSSISSSFGPSIFLPIFQGGRLRSQVDAAEAQALQIELGYKQTVLEALQEVENALYAYQQEQLRLEKLNEGVVAGEATVVQVRSLYENGLVTFLNVLDAERNLASLQDSAAASLGQSSRNLVSVYQAFGGGWDAPEFEAPEHVVEQSRTDVSENEAELFVESKAAGVLTLKIESYLRYTRMDEASQGMVDEIKVQMEDSEVLSHLLPGERVRIKWTEVEVVQAEQSFHEVEVNGVERLSPESP
ncbi:efflux transporter outer membrane subunit [Kiritimatiellaeota bacterium B1221]|nr:efflux transporter outer membrane subunit [Kiritimatiellaeota bacterium B1221]